MNLGYVIGELYVVQILMAIQIGFMVWIGLGIRRTTLKVQKLTEEERNKRQR